MALCVLLNDAARKICLARKLKCWRVGDFHAQIKGVGTVLCFPDRNGWFACQSLYSFRLSYAAMDWAVSFLRDMRYVIGR